MPTTTGPMPALLWAVQQTARARKNVTIPGKALADAARRSGPQTVLQRRRESLEFTRDKLLTVLGSSLERKKIAFLSTVDKLSALNPLSILKRGYSVVEARGSVVSSVSDISIGDTVSVRLSDGSFDAEVKSVFGGKNK